MGKLASRPKLPAISSPASVTVPTPDPTPIVTPITPDPQEVEKTRIENIARRGRSLAGNVLTSLRGVLSASSLAPQRKNLLGE